MRVDTPGRGHLRGDHDVLASETLLARLTVRSRSIAGPRCGSGIGDGPAPRPRPKRLRQAAWKRNRQQHRREASGATVLSDGKPRHRPLWSRTGQNGTPSGEIGTRATIFEPRLGTYRWPKVAPRSVNTARRDFGQPGDLATKHGLRDYSNGSTDKGTDRDDADVGGPTRARPEHRHNDQRYDRSDTETGKGSSSPASSVRDVGT
jgi:hypothetical protein